MNKAEKKIKTLHPKGKSGVRISLTKYEIIREEIFTVLEKESLPFMKLAQAIEERIGHKFDGSVSWYTIAVKQDLEARGFIGIVPKTRPPQLTLKKTE